MTGGLIPVQILLASANIVLPLAYLLVAVDYGFVFFAAAPTARRIATPALRGTIGASINRLQSASNVINNQVQNLTSAENTITAADIPTAVAQLTKYTILEQTGISALAQANQQQQLVLKLLQ